MNEKQELFHSPEYSTSLEISDNTSFQELVKQTHETVMQAADLLGSLDYASSSITDVSNEKDLLSALESLNAVTASFLDNYRQKLQGDKALKTSNQKVNRETLNQIHHLLASFNKDFIRDLSFGSDADIPSKKYLWLVQLAKIKETVDAFLMFFNGVIDSVDDMPLIKKIPHLIAQIKIDNPEDNQDEFISCLDNYLLILIDNLVSLQSELSTPPEVREINLLLKRVRANLDEFFHNPSLMSVRKWMDKLLEPINHSKPVKTLAAWFIEEKIDSNQEEALLLQENLGCFQVKEIILERILDCYPRLKRRKILEEFSAEDKDHFVLLWFYCCQKDKSFRVSNSNFQAKQCNALAAMFNFFSMERLEINFTGIRLAESCEGNNPNEAVVEKWKSVLGMLSKTPVKDLHLSFINPRQTNSYFTIDQTTWRTIFENLPANMTHLTLTIPHLMALNDEHWSAVCEAIKSPQLNSLTLQGDPRCSLLNKKQEDMLWAALKESRISMLNIQGAFLDKRYEKKLLVAITLRKDRGLISNCCYSLFVTHKATLDKQGDKAVLTFEKEEQQSHQRKNNKDNKKDTGPKFYTRELDEKEVKVLDDLGIRYT